MTGPTGAEPEGSPPANAPAPAAIGAPAPPPRPLASIVPIGRHEPVDGICGRIDAAPSLAVVLHAPGGNRAMAEELGMRRVARHVERSGRVFAVATRSGVLARRARAQGVPVSWSPHRVHWGSGGKVAVPLGFATLLVPPFGRYSQYVALAIFVLAVVAALITAGPSATVRVYPPTQTAESLATVRASARIDEPDIERGLLPATVITIERKVLLAVPTTGEVVLGVSAATATVRLTNTTDEAVDAPAGAILFALPDLIAFETDIAVTVPAGGAGFVPVTAREPGVAGNVPAGAISRWRNEALDALTASNPDPASGGEDAPRRAASSEDLLRLQALADEIGAGTPPAALLADARPGHGIILRSATVTVETGEPTALPGDAADAVYMEVRTTIEALAIPPEALEALARALFGGPDAAIELIPGALRAVETGEGQIDHPDGSFTSELRLTAEFPIGPDRAAIVEAVGGRSPASAQAELATRYGIEDVEIDLTPGWAPRLPRFGFRIEVQFAGSASEREAPNADAESSPPAGP